MTAVKPASPLCYVHTQRKCEVFEPTLGSTTTAAASNHATKQEIRHTRSTYRGCKSAAYGQTTNKLCGRCSAAKPQHHSSSGAIDHGHMPCLSKSQHNRHTYTTQVLLRYSAGRYAYVCTHTRHQKLHLLFFVTGESGKGSRQHQGKISSGLARATCMCTSAQQAYERRTRARTSEHLPFNTKYSLGRYIP